MKTVELSAALNSAQVVENLKNFVGVDAQGAAALMTPERLAAVAGEPANFCKTIMIQPKGIIDFEVHQCALFFIAVGNYPSLALLYGNDNKGKILSQDLVSFFFNKDNENTLNIYRDESGWHMLNNRNDSLAITYRIIAIEMSWQ